MGDANLLTELGIGGIFAILVIREVIPLMRNGKAKENGVLTRTEFDEHRKSVQYRDNCEQIVKRIDGRFDDIEKRDQERASHLNGQFAEVKQLLRARGT